MHSSKNPHTPKKITRREVLKAMAIVAGGVALNHVGRGLVITEAKGNVSKLDTEIYIPLVTKYGSKSSRQGGACNCSKCDNLERSEQVLGAC